MVVEVQVDHRIKEDICGVGHVDQSGREWVCISKPHDTVYFRRKSDRTHHRGDPVFSSNPGVDKHYMVNRWPNRKKDDHGG